MNVTRLARQYNGHSTWAFSQFDLNVWRHYRTFGICAALSAEWIRCHANDGSLANELGGGGVGPLNVAKLREIALRHRLASSGNDTQDNYFERYLQQHHVVSLRISGPRRFFNSRTQRDETRPSWTPAALEREGGAPNIENDIVAQMKKLKSCYVRINFSGTVLRHAAGHAVAAWLGQPTQDRITWARDRITGLRPVPDAQDYFHKGTSGDAVFFDPAYGEYWFEQKDDFFHFFPVFYRAAYRSFPMYFDQAWQVLPCAKSI